MRISKDELVAGYPALTVRTFLRRYRSFPISAPAAAQELDTDEHQAGKFLSGLKTLGLIEPAEAPLPDNQAAYEITIKGNALANATAAKPIRRSTAEFALRQFLGRLDRLNASGEYVYRVVSAVLFGSMLSSVEHLGDVDIAIEFEPKITEDPEFRSRCEARRLLATRRGKHFSSMIDSVLWPKTEIFRALRARARALSLHEWNQVVRIPRVRYRVLFGDRERIAQVISAGECVDGAVTSD
jgi:predicted nucleotidyltransferase